MRVLVNKEYSLLTVLFIISLLIVLAILWIFQIQFNDAAAARSLGIVSLTTLANYSKQKEIFNYLTVIIFVPVLANILFYVLEKPYNKKNDK